MWKMSRVSDVFRQSDRVHRVGEGQLFVQRRAGHLVKVVVTKAERSFIVFYRPRSRVLTAVHFTFFRHYFASFATSHGCRRRLVAFGSSGRSCYFSFQNTEVSVSPCRAASALCRLTSDQ